MSKKNTTVPESAHQTPLGQFLADWQAVSKRQAKAFLDARSVFVNDRRVWMARHLLQTGDRVELTVPIPPDETKKIPILHRDADLVVADKPAGILSNGAKSLESILRQQLRNPDLLAVHRLDRDTTGCLIFAMSPSVKTRMIQIFKEDRITKVYRAIVIGRLPKGDGQFTRTLDGKRASTKYQVLASSQTASHVRVKLETGRTHQIRRHFAAAGHPVVGDTHYATDSVTHPTLKQASRQMLHAESVRFPHPLAKGSIEVKAPLARDFVECLRRLHIA